MIREKAFYLLYKSVALPLMKFLVKKTGGNQEVAEEVFSTTMIAAWQGFQRFENKSSYFTWICRIALNKLADYYRSQIHYESKFIAPGLEMVSKLHDPKMTPEERLLLAELRSEIRNCLMLLPDEKRKLLYLRYWQDMSVQKIALLVNSTERGVEGKLYRAKQEVRALLEKRQPQLLLNILTYRD